MLHASFKNMKHKFSARHSHKCTHMEPSSTYIHNSPVKSFFLVTPIQLLCAIPKGTCCGIYFRICYTARLERHIFSPTRIHGNKNCSAFFFFFQCFFQHGLRGKEKNHKPPVGDFLLYACILYF